MRVRWLAFVVFLGACVLSEGTLSPEEYNRRDWRHWVDEDGDCQDTRQEVLIASSQVAVKYEDARECRVESGLWLDPYTGGTFTDPGDLDIDHLVALREAHDTGGAEWDAARKRAFANDTRNLFAVAAGANRSKGSRGPAEWLPPNPAYRCEFIRQWVEVKQTWELQMPQCESVTALLVQCNAGEIPSLPQAR